MKKFSALLILTISAFLVSATPAKNDLKAGSGNDDFLVIRFRPSDPKTNERIYFSINDYEDGKTFFWNFGDGTEQVIGTGSVCSHLYSKPGTYRVKVHSNGGEAANEMVMITN